jgi:excinuclease ABC subunit C
MKPSKQDYRHYNIKTVVGPDDYASMKEVVYRRYKRLLDEEQPLPDLIVADGGKGQMEVIRQAVQDELGLDISIAGLAKNDKHRTNEFLYGFPPRVVGMKDTSELFRVLTQLQDEVHRFAITFHRDKRSKRALHSEMDDIKGIGPKTRDELLNALKSVKQIKEATQEKIAEIVGPAKAQIIYQHFHP